MRALVLNKPEGLRYVPDYPDPRPARGEVLVRVLAAGICETDLQLARGYMGFSGVPGHEFVGVAEEGPFRGRRVVGEINCSCRTCKVCRSGLPNHCPERSVLGILKHDGAFADLVAVPQENLHPVPDEVSTVAAVFVEPLAAAFRVPEQVSLRAKQEVVVLGDGRLGNLCAQVLRLSGCRVTVVGKHDSKLDVLARLGIPVQHLDRLPGRRLADVVVDCTGSPTGLPTALSIVRRCGTVVLKTTVSEPHSASLAPVVIDEVTIVGSRCGPFPAALAALRDGRVDVAPLVDSIFDLEQGPAAFEAARTTEALKLLLAVDPSFAREARQAAL